MKPLSSLPDPDLASHFASLEDDIPVAQSTTAVAIPAPTAARLNHSDLIRVVAPLTAFLAANCNRQMLDASPLRGHDDPHRDLNTLRICYRLDSLYFTGVDTTLDEPLFALMRASRRGRPKPRHRIAITTERSHRTNRGLHWVWSALVISVSRHADEEECLRQINQMLLSVLRPENMRPLNDWERRTLGRNRSEN